ncbi:hypothetical protein D6D06_09391 [Aureobasidium pullulans]|nr:hypothetical protein D6D06_09391 [Aureobasidium pullulans]
MASATRSLPILSLQAAEAAALASQQKAKELGIDVNIAIVDSTLHLLHFTRMPTAKLTSISIAINKAFTAAGHRHPTSDYNSPTFFPGGMGWGIQISDKRVLNAAVAARDHEKSIEPFIARKKLCLAEYESKAKTEVNVYASPSLLLYIVVDHTNAFVLQRTYGSTKVTIERPINHFGVLTTGELVDQILTHLREDPPALCQMMTVNS